MCDIDETLGQLVMEARALPSHSLQRRQLLQTIYQRVMQSKRLWRESGLDYADALQDTWEYCLQHLEEYDPALGSVITWLDHHLKRRLRTLRDRRQRDRKRHTSKLETRTGEILDPVDDLPARSDIDPVFSIWEKTLDWVQTDPDGILRQTHFRQRPDINAQILFLKRFPTETPWKEIAEQFHLNEAEAKDLPKFYNRSCLSLIRAFGVSQGYITSK